MPAARRPEAGGAGSGMAALGFAFGSGSAAALQAVGGSGRPSEAGEGDVEAGPGESRGGGGLRADWHLSGPDPRHVHGVLSAAPRLPRAARGPLASVRGRVGPLLGTAALASSPGSPTTALTVAKLKRSRLKVRFCTNESQKSLEYLVGLLRGLGFDISEGDVTAPAPATCLILKERGLRPHLLISDGIRSEFDQIDTTNPNCVVMADAGEGFSYQNMNKAFQVLMELENPVLISLGKGRYYKETSGLMLDIGAYVKALEYACGIEAEVVGKPSPEFFKSALREMGVEAHQAIMIGDDIEGDIGGAQRCGMRALQVRTGKFR
ncbi:PREDICTED: phospholysine phosphohistidine inorganic pyrophosphate phosphatase [Ceratotherium simum simum]|uniref:Phospholysine phosphohistidine inorganic pyrophosphate phosphatase n=1 Tax=Ceratotherium simum simum TaxID=73337 RepID=A0ABM1DCK2_CERSS|nr:PREDICTED: phospholysine phosphohistidine inorganic pyrophosphate phosphatase [Ceratotherium simum simum]